MSVLPLDPPVAARTALASTHGVSLVLRSRHVEGRLAAVDDGGEPVLLTGGGQLPVGPALVGAASDRPGVGRVLLDGVLHRVVGADRRELLELVGRHLECFSGLDLEALRLARLAVTRVRWAPAASSVHHVPLDTYAGAEPCPWTLFAERYVDHLNRDHAALVAALATRVSGRHDTIGWVREVGPSGLTLAVVDQAGARLHTVLFARSAPTPSEGIRMLAQQTGMIAHHICGTEG